MRHESRGMSGFGSCLGVLVGTSCSPRGTSYPPWGTPYSLRRKAKPDARRHSRRTSEATHASLLMPHASCLVTHASCPSLGTRHSPTFRSRHSGCLEACDNFSPNRAGMRKLFLL